MLQPHEEGRRVLWGGMPWAVLDRYDNGELELMRSIIPMQKYENVRVHESEVTW
ncbi:hypothetical protein SEA_IWOKEUPLIKEDIS_40 [Mycobacterium phage Iwokeuplikedis]|nr:hypothetical protein SEA_IWOKEUPLIKEDIS_40 [Mycobacterium phage Iwokeuplikedis]